MGNVLDALAVPLVVVLYLVKQSMMGDDWEPTDLQEIGGPLLFFAALAAVSWFQFKHGVDPLPDQGGAAVQAVPEPLPVAAVPLSRQTKMSCLVAIVVTLMVTASSVAPSMVGSHKQALARFVSQELKGYGHKKGLQYVLAGYLHARITDVEFRGDREAIAHLTVEAPLLPAAFASRDLSSRSATNAFFNLPAEERRSTEVIGTVRLESTGLGWSVSTEDIVSKVEAAQAQSMSGTLDRSLTQPLELFSTNIFGIEDAALGGLSIVMGLVCVLFGIAAAVANPRATYAPLLGTAIASVMMLAPTILLYAV